MGKPIAFVGHKVLCPKCKGVFPIVEGAPTTTFYGKGVALAGMKTACGASLIATQFTDIVECGGGDASAASQSTTSSFSTAPSFQPMKNAIAPAEASAAHFDDKFVLLDDDTGDPLSNTEYAIRRASGEIEHGTTDAHGCTHLLAATVNAELVEIYV
ncbi:MULTISPECIES: PAAR domain-containing protein [unclassified Massilia]|uniref:PAAR domain-containing protein n=1 Tax=unclassified Massilia TaxID=2609279 RepID=UPI001E43A2BE|nr:MULTISPECIES: PAAR domain-containing protein [unclassified Massilia]